MGKKCKKKVQWRQLSLNEPQQGSSEQEGEECEEDEGEGSAHTPPHDPGSPYSRSPYGRPPHHHYPPHFPRRGAHHHGYYYRNFDKRFDRRGGFDKYNHENLRNFENRGPYAKPPFYERQYYYDNKYYGRPPCYGDRNFKFGYVERGRRPFRPYGRPGFFPRGFPGPYPDGGYPKEISGCGGQEEDEEEEEWEEIPAEDLHTGSDGGDRPSQPVHTVMINNEEYTKIQTPRQEVIFKKSSLDRKQDSLDQGSVTGSMTSGSGSCSTGGDGPASAGGSGDQLAGDQVSLSGSMEDNSLSVGGDDPSDVPSHHDQVFEDPSDMFVSEGGGPPLAGVVMQQAYPGGPMFTIPVHWTPFIDPGLIPGETALTPLDPAFTHVIDPKTLPIDPVHILPVQHDATGCPVQVQVKVDSNGVPIQIEPSAFTVSLSTLQHAHPEAKDQTDATPREGVTQDEHSSKRQRNGDENVVHRDGQEMDSIDRVEEIKKETIEERGEEKELQQDTLQLEEESSKREEIKDMAQIGVETEHQQTTSADDVVSTVSSPTVVDDDTVPAASSPTVVDDDTVPAVSSPTVVDDDTVPAVSSLTVVDDDMVPAVSSPTVVDDDTVPPVSSPTVVDDDTVPAVSSPTVVDDDTVPAVSSPVCRDYKAEGLSAGEVREAGQVESVVDQMEHVEVKEGGMATTLSQEPLSEVLEKISEKESETPEELSNAVSQEQRTTPSAPVTGTHDQVVVVVQPMEEEDEEEEEEEDEEEDMLTKESEEGSDSSDSQYASMSESSTTPTTPEGEPSDAHDTPAPALTAPHAPHTSAKVDSGVSTTSPQTATPEDIPEVECCTDATDSQPTDTQATDNSSTQTSILQGYVMVPILTPYYDPSVLYGYPVVVTNQQQQQQPPPPPPQHCYGKRKKKKYQRRRHADVPAAGGYLDPQLYTGEPFVATPGGYVVPIEAGASVCQVHGLQYVTPQAFHQQPPDEGFVSVQHSPYLPEVASDPPSAEVQQSEGTSQDEASKTVFSDLQDTERRQIQEMLQERAKGDKSDSTESSDSGVSESEETAAAELSCDELESCKQQSSQTALPSVSANAEELTTGENSSTTLPHQEEIVSGSQRIVSEAVSQKDSTEKAIAESNITQPPEVSTGEFCNAQHQITDDNSSVAVESNDNPIESVSEIHTLELICAETLQTGYLDGHISNQSPVSSDEVRSNQGNFQGAEKEITVADTESCDHGPEVETDIVTLQVIYEIPVEETIEKEVPQDKIPENETCFDANLTTTKEDTESEDGSALGTIANFINESPERVQESNINQSDSSLEIKTDIINEEVYESSVVSTTLQEKPQINNRVTCEHLEEFVSPHSHFKKQASSGSEVIHFDAESFHEKVQAEENPIISGSEVAFRANPRSKCNITGGETDGNGIDQGSFKDLKVTEAVKRWIREVTPEKAFTLSKVQTRLLADQDLFKEMDTEDEYIEDEISEDTKSITVMEPKNVKGNPFVAASSDVPNVGMEGCSKRVAVINRLRGTSPDTLDEYDGASTISNLSYDHLYSEASSSHPASINHSFDDEEVDKYTENPDIYNPTAYAKYYQLGVELDETTPIPTPSPEQSHEATPTAQYKSETVSECGSEDVETIPHKYDVVSQHTGTSPMSLATEILKAEKVLSNMAHIAGAQQDLALAEERFGNPDIYLKHFSAVSHGEVGDSGVQSEESSDETEARSNVSSSGVGSSLASTPAISPAHHLPGRPPLQSHPLKNLSAREGPVPCRTVCCAVM